MKLEIKLTIAFVLLALIFALGCLISVGVHADSPERFEHLYTKKFGFTDDSTTFHAIETWHDTESGTEFTCVIVSDYVYSVSCFPTGRNWK
jgi:hypothetical protein